MNDLVEKMKKEEERVTKTLEISQKYVMGTIDHFVTNKRDSYQQVILRRKE